MVRSPLFLCSESPHPLLFLLKCSGNSWSTILNKEFNQGSSTRRSIGNANENIMKRDEMVMITIIWWHFLLSFQKKIGVHTSAHSKNSPLFKNGSHFSDQKMHMHLPKCSTEITMHDEYFWHICLAERNLFFKMVKNVLCWHLARFPAHYYFHLLRAFLSFLQLHQRLRCPTGNLSIDNIRQMVYYLLDSWPTKKIIESLDK